MAPSRTSSESESSRSCILEAEAFSLQPSTSATIPLLLLILRLVLLPVRYYYRIYLPIRTTPHSHREHPLSRSYYLRKPRRVGYVMDFLFSSSPSLPVPAYPSCGEPQGQLTFKVLITSCNTRSRCKVSSLPWRARQCGIHVCGLPSTVSHIADRHMCIVYAAIHHRSLLCCLKAADFVVLTSLPTFFKFFLGGAWLC